MKNVISFVAIVFIASQVFAVNSNEKVIRGGGFYSVEKPGPMVRKGLEECGGYFYFSFIHLWNGNEALEKVQNRIDQAFSEGVDLKQMKRRRSTLVIETDARQFRELPTNTLQFLVDLENLGAKVSCEGSAELPKTF